MIILRKVALQAFVKRFTDAQPGLHNPFAVNLRQIMIRQEEMNLIRKLDFQLRRPVKHPPTVLRAVCVEVISMDQLVQHQVSLRMICQIGSGDELVEVVAMIVDVAGHPDLAFAREMHHLLMAHRSEFVFIAGGVKASIT